MDAMLFGKPDLSVVNTKEVNEKPSILDFASYAAGPDGGNVELIVEKITFLSALF